MLKQKITPAEVADVKKLFDNCRNVVIVCHVSPDGDAVGSSLGLYEYLKRKGKNVNVIVPNYFPDFLRWMKDADRIVQFDRQKSHSYTLISTADLICCLDFNVLTRIEDLAEPVGKARCKKLLIDHHIGPDKSVFDVVVSRPEASSTCELVFRVISALGDIQSLTFAGAEDIYAGMATDTGFFSFNSNDPDIFIILSELLRKGIDKDLINRRIQNNFSPDRLRLIGYVLYEKLVVNKDLHASYFSLTRDELSKFHYIKGDMEALSTCLFRSKVTNSASLFVKTPKNLSSTSQRALWMTSLAMNSVLSSSMEEDTKTLLVVALNALWKKLSRWQKQR